MSPTALWLAGIFLAAPGPDEAELRSLRESRIETIATAISLETRSPEEAALVAATVWEESGRLRNDVQDGRRRGDKGKAICLGQVHAQRALPRAEWAATVGLDTASMRRCIAVVVRLYRVIGAKCDRRGDALEERLARRAAAYATGKSCRPAAWKGARPRARRALAWLRTAPSSAGACTAAEPCRFALR